MSEKDINIPENVETSSEKKSNLKNKKKSKSPVLAFFKFLFTFVFIIFVLFAALGAFCVFDRKAPLAAIPRNYSAYLHTDAAFNSVNPLLDLRAADIMLSSPEFIQYRKIFMDLRSSPLRENRILRFALNRSVDVGLYGSVKRQDYLAVVDLGVFSAITRLADFVVPKISIPGLRLMNGEDINYYLYDAAGSTIYLKPVKNLLVASSSLELLMTSAFAKNDSLYTKEQLKMLNEAKGKSLCIVADARKLAEDFTGSDELLRSMASLISPDSLSVISFNISDRDISIKGQIPVEEDYSDNSLLPILRKKSHTPAILSRFGESVQYYTILNAGSLSELKDAVFPVIPKDKNADKVWKNAEGLCKSVFGMDIEDLIFSWTGNEFAAIGLENHNDPIFAIQIKNEKQRKKIFEKISGTMFVKEDDSLILNGIRIPRLELPSFLNWILDIFDISVPSPYFIVHNDFIYFSQSPETLCQLYAETNSGKYLTKISGWQQVSSAQRSESSVSLFYDLEKSAPFFLRSNKAVSKVLRLYNQGRFDVRTRGNAVEFQLQACTEDAGSRISIPGFPVSAGQNVKNEDFCFVEEFNLLAWVENQKIVKALNLSDMKIKEAVQSDYVEITAAASSSAQGIIWTVSPQGVVNLLNENLESTGKFPVLLGSDVSARASACEDGLYVPLENESVAFITYDGDVSFVEIPDISVKAPVGVLKNTAALYDKGFIGRIFYIEKNKVLNSTETIDVEEIGLGSPAVIKSGSKPVVAFISQSGTLSVWNGTKIQKNFPVKLDGVFLVNVVASEKYIYAISSDAQLYRVGLNDGKVLNIKIPNSTAKNAYLSVKKLDGRYCVFVNADSNIIYGFSENLELLSGFPLTGSGFPVFADVNGDNLRECLSLSLDKKIVAWKIR